MNICANVGNGLLPFNYFIESTFPVKKTVYLLIFDFSKSISYFFISEML